MTTNQDKYPNKDDYEPRVLHPVKGAIKTDELPLADPSDSNSTATFRENAHKKVKEQKPSAYSENKPESSGGSGGENYHNLKQGERFPFGDQEQYNREHNQKAHKKWNEERNNK